MWKIKIEYGDNSSTILEGKHKDIPLDLAIQYFNQYVAGRSVKSIYQRHPKKKYDEIGLYEKIEELMASEEEEN